MQWTPRSRRSSRWKSILKMPAVVAEDLAAGDLAVAGDAGLVGDLVARQLLLGRAHHGDLGDRVDADREVIGHRPGVDAEGVRRRRGAPARSTWRRGSGSRSRRPRRRCAAPRSGTARRRRAGRASSAASPAAARLSRSVAPTRPAENSTMSATMCLPDSSCSTARGGGSVAHGERLDRLAEAEGDVAVRASGGSARRRSRGRGTRAPGRGARPRVTATPRAANIEAYSMPITPAPTTARVRGRCSSRTMSSVVRIDLAVRRHAGRGRRVGADRDHDVGRGDPARALLATSITSVWGSTKAASPGSTTTSLRRSWSSITSISRATTRSTPAKSCAQDGRPVHPRPRQPVALAGDARSTRGRPRAGSCWGWCRCRCTRRPPAALLDDRRPLAELGRLHGRPLPGRPGADAHEVEVIHGTSCHPRGGTHGRGRFSPRRRRNGGRRLDGTAGTGTSPQ